MRKLSLISVLLLLIVQLWAQQNPHGKDFILNCADCHTTGGWKYSASAAFNHNNTQFKLEGQHVFTNCRECHTSLVFAETKTNCSDCHTDMHNTTVGNDCAKCHTPKSWIVNNITEIHQQSRFPLLGAHNTADCSACHTSASKLEFQPLGVECIDCHRTDYNETKNPNHVQTGLSTNCIECHKIEAFEWTSSGYNHNFFPLTKGHQINECSACHTGDVFQPLSAECFSCHQTDFNTATNPKHKQPDFSTKCTDCHTTDVDWKPAKFDIHDASFFPIYSGEHKGEWESCTDCHKQSENYSSFTCIDCHEHNKSDMDKEHREENGYAYNSNACFACHPTGNKDGAFNHSKTDFPLKGAHVQTDCLQCHTNGYSGTSMLCNSCHTKDYQEAVKPAHATAGISTECEICHDETKWIPSTFNHTATSGFELTNGHSGRQCSECHTGNTTSASSECVSCHQENYNEAPNHISQKFPVECLQCHNTKDWGETTFNHNTTAFPLTGSHVATECAACHTAGYAGTAKECNACHSDNYTSAQNPGHTAAGISKECQTCHGTTTWIPSTFNHTATSGFELTNGHSGRQCSECHTGNTTSASSECVSCHRENYNEAPNHVSQKFPVECLQCHNTKDWKEYSFNHNNTAFPLTGSHVATECAACHTAGYAGTAKECNACHNDNYTSAQNPGHTTAGISKECQTCHGTTSWIPSTFNHSAISGFELTNGHSGKQCSECHKGNTTSASSECVSCHRENYNEAANHVSQKFPVECLQCHNTKDWKEYSFNHNNTAFPLTGSHVATECAACHTAGYTGTAKECNACHNDNYTSAQNPGHTTAGISKECQTCHGTTSWIPSTFNHTATSGFELTNGHSGRQCSECHTGNTTSASSECVSCHQENYNEAPNHVSQKFPVECLQCHNTKDWREYSFNHNNTAFPLTGSHVATECAACHTAGYAGTAKECNACHNDNYTAAQNPGHTAAGISKECQTCHGTTTWIPSTFNHTATSGFELTNGHSGRQCFECHTGNTTSASSECVSCHKENYNEAPNHVSQKFPLECLQCHNTKDWKEYSFNHNNTAFPLTGSHVATECAACHTAGYAGTAKECNACHNDNYTSAQNPGHTAAGISKECQTCHGTTTWIPSTFNHTATTGFELTNGHSGRQCSECHTGNTTSASSECVSCHQENYNEAPNHVSQKFPLECLQCHNTKDWGETTFNHNSTSFPLTGAHIATECSACHSSGYSGTAKECNACHQNDYSKTTNPNHSSLGLSVNCNDCHSTNPGWEPALFPNHVAYYPLKGAHSAVAANCYLCHTGNYVNTPNTCFGCHSADYNSTKDPAHVTAQFPTDCEACHTETAWEPATFNHDAQYFPIYSGEHRGEWAKCTDCHTQPSNYAVFSCINCHEHNKTDMDNEHKGEKGYVYNSVNCFTCHPKGDS